MVVFYSSSLLWSIESLVFYSSSSSCGRVFSSGAHLHFETNFAIFPSGASASPAPVTSEKYLQVLEGFPFCPLTFTTSSCHPKHSLVFLHFAPQPPLIAGSAI